MKIKEISEKELDELLKRLQEAVDNDISITKADMQLVIEIVFSFSHLTSQIADNDITLHKLKKLAGLVKSSEKLKDLVTITDKEKPERNKTEKLAKIKKEEIIHEFKHHKIEVLAKGQCCPDCGKGTLYKDEPREFIRVSGNLPYLITKHHFERLRCNTCQQNFMADAPKEITEDGEIGQKYGYSARAVMAIHKYFAGLPFHRQESLNGLFDTPISSSSVFDQVEKVSNSLLPVFNYLKKLAADSDHFCIDDTTNRILEAGKEIIPDRKTGKPRERSGVYTSAILSYLPAGFDEYGKLPDNKIILFKTNIGHAGEFIDEILKNRNANAPPPIIMSDALNRNMPTVIKNYHRALCNAHARREFVEIHKQFPDKVEWVLKEYAKIWEINKNLRPEERLQKNKIYSLPVMERIKKWSENQIETNQTEENSSLGRAIKYFLNNFDGLTTFCHVSDTRLDNNELESVLKIVIRARKNSLFFKTQAGADISDVITSIIATCEKIGLNSFFYLTEIQKFPDAVRKNPENFLPWNYYRNIENLKKEKNFHS